MATVLDSLLIMSPSPSNKVDKVGRRRRQNREAQRNHRKQLREKLLAYDQIIEQFESVRMIQDQEHDNESERSPLQPSVLQITPIIEQTIPSGSSTTAAVASDIEETTSARVQSGHNNENVERETDSNSHALETYHFASTFDHYTASFTPVQETCSLVHDAVQKGNVEILALLIEHGADPAIKDSTGSTPLHLASQLGNEELAKLLLQQDSCAIMFGPNTNGLTPLRLAVRNGHASVVKLLLDAGLDVNES